MSIVPDLQAVGKTHEWLTDQIYSGDWHETDPDAEPRALSTCSTCHGTGRILGDVVPYGSTTATLPDAWCDCMDEQAWEWLMRKILVGEWTLDVETGRYWPV